MATANTQPIFPLTPKTTWGTITTANTAKDGTGIVVTIATGGNNGSKVDQIKVRAMGTNVATVMRFFVNNGSVNTVAANNSLFYELTLVATILSETSSLADNDVTVVKNTTETAVPIPYLPNGYKINITIGTTVAAGFSVTTNLADY